MTAPESLVALVSERVVARETAMRIGRALPYTEVMSALPPGAPPLTALAGSTFPPELLGRRLRFLARVGWLPEPVAEWSPALPPTLPPQATLEDELAVLASARAVRAEDAALAALAAALGAPVVDVEVPAPDPGFYPAFFDGLADRATPGWRGRLRAPYGPWPVLEVALADTDRFFGRRRAWPVWPAARRAVRWSARWKRRWLS